MIGILVGLELFAPKLPAPLFAVGLGIIGACLLNLQAHGVELVGHIRRGYPPSPFQPFRWPRNSCPALWASR